MDHIRATLLAGDMSTTAMSVAARDAEGREVFATIPIRGTVTWHGAPGFDLDPTPALLLEALDEFESQGWSFRGEEGTISFSIRQHDMVLLDRDGKMLIPALSWQCNAATAEVQELRDRGVESSVGTIEERFVLPKLLWALRQDNTLRSRLANVMTSGDFIAWQLTGTMRLSASDALSNGLLDHQRGLAAEAIATAGLEPAWFPPVVRSGHPVGVVASSGKDEGAWSTLRNRFGLNWSVAAGLGDNHAGAVGCGLADEVTIVISAGSSGTVTRQCPPGAQRLGKTLGFEYYDNTLLLMMLADCAVWYDRFLAVLDGPNTTDHDAANADAAAISPETILPITHETRDGQGGEIYPEGFASQPRGVQIASTQYAIAVELLQLIHTMAHEVKNAAAPVRCFLLTGGLSRSPFFQGVLRTGIERMQPDAIVEVSARTDRLAFQSATYGALINAHVAGRYAALPDVIRAWCPRRNCSQPDPSVHHALSARLEQDLPFLARPL